VIAIPRGDENGAGARWKLVYELGGRRNAKVWCPRGHYGYLDDHEIAADGTVTPSLVCPDDHCDWHVNGRLVGWEPQ